MSNGYLVACAADLDDTHEIAEGFGLDVIDAASISDHEGFANALAAAANVGLVISAAASIDDRYVALLRTLALRLGNAQLIVVGDDGRQAFGFLPHQWPFMSMDEAKSRSARRRGANLPADAPRAAPLPPQAAPEPLPSAAEQESVAEPEAAPPAPDTEETPATAETESATGAAEQGERARDEAHLEAPAPEAPASETVDPSAPQHDPPPEPPPAPAAKRSAPPLAGAPAPAGAQLDLAPRRAPADATAFAPKKLRRGTPELVRIVIHQPSQLRDVIKAARKLDPNTEPAPQGIALGDVAMGESIGIALDVRGASCDGALQRRTWRGAPIDFSYSVEAEEDAKQAVFLARVFVGDAQIGVLAFTRKISGPAKKPAAAGDVRLTRHKRVFLSYSSADRETVSVIATAYARAGVPFFWDRASLKSGEEWSPRLRREIDRADLFHLCWSKAAAQSEWVAKEAEHALNARRRKKRPEITVQMLDGPPWAPHPPHLDAINFDDFVRAAIVGYQRGESG